MGLLGFLCGSRTTKIKDYLERGAVILDVRTINEYESHHIEGVIHIPISELKSSIDTLKKLNVPIVAHCASGVRSARASQILMSYGIDAINGGGINTVKKALQ